MKSQRLKVILVAALAVVVAIDLIHAILNRIFNPFTGPLDDAMHFVLPVAPVFYFAACLWGCFRLAKRFSTTGFLSEGHYASLILLALIASQFAFTLLTPARSGSSSYHPLFPDFLGGILLAMATLIAGREHLHSQIGRVAVVLVVFFWSAGSLTVDLLWWTERTSRGVGPVWHLPLIAPLLAAISYFFIFAGRLVEVCLYFPEAILKVGAIIQCLWFLMLVVLLAWCLRWLTSSRAWWKSLGLAASIVFLGWKATEWGSFIAD